MKAICFGLLVLGGVSVAVGKGEKLTIGLPGDCTWVVEPRGDAPVRRERERGRGEEKRGGAMSINTCQRDNLGEEGDETREGIKEELWSSSLPHL